MRGTPWLQIGVLGLVVGGSVYLAVQSIREEVARLGRVQAAPAAAGPPSAEVAPSLTHTVPAGKSTPSPSSPAPAGPRVRVEVYVPPLFLPIGSVYRPVLNRLSELEEAWPQLQVIRYEVDDPATAQALRRKKIRLPGTILVEGRDVYFLQEGKQKRKVVLRLGQGATLQFTLDDLEAVLRQAIQAKAAAHPTARGKQRPP